MSAPLALRGLLQAGAACRLLRPALRSGARGLQVRAPLLATAIMRVQQQRLFCAADADASGRPDEPKTLPNSWVDPDDLWECDSDDDTRTDVDGAGSRDGEREEGDKANESEAHEALEREGPDSDKVQRSLPFVEK
mmetsp:Transcript_49061/g.126429  ORF Transcript_49061/g.126429 Transcript_49061/m.126429 type:complete len:136 (-) Transcript_49061:184-591(-)